MTWTMMVNHIDNYLTVLRLSGNYKDRQRIKLSNQQLPVFCAEARSEVLEAVARGVLAQAFLESLEAQRPTPGKPLPLQFAEYVARAVNGAAAIPEQARSGEEAHAK
jgi:hypothetical protein